MASASTPKHFIVPIFPGFQFLDLAGPLDILNMLSSSQPALSLKFIAETLDPVPVKPIVPKSADWSFDLQDAFPESGGKINTAFNEYLQPDTTYADYLEALNSTSADKPVLDVMLIPGGVGTRLTRIHPDGSKSSNIRTLLDFIPEVVPHIRTAIFTVCTGSYTLALTGILNGRRATTNMSRFDDVARQNPGVSWQHGARWVRSLPSEVPGSASIEIWTSAGISAGVSFVTSSLSPKSCAMKIFSRFDFDFPHSCCSLLV